MHVLCRIHSRSRPILYIFFIKLTNLNQYNIRIPTIVE
ncbi:unnamed protein product [Spodoptera exigua]|nr:unnamed protein product [Spodoptera exigua]